MHLIRYISIIFSLIQGSKMVLVIASMSSIEQFLNIKQRIILYWIGFCELIVLAVKPNRSKILP